jgi:hypothetical protein
MGLFFLPPFLFSWVSFKLCNHDIGKFSLGFFYDWDELEFEYCILFFSFFCGSNGNCAIVPSPRFARGVRTALRSQFVTAIWLSSEKIELYNNNLIRDKGWNLEPYQLEKS